jgi:mono/diheme cytochrome c family protein
MESPARFHEDSRMPAYAPPALSHQEIEELAQYLATLRGRGDQKAEFYDTFPPPRRP